MTTELRQRIDEDELDKDEIWDEKNILRVEILDALQKTKVRGARKNAKFRCDVWDKR